MPGKEEKENMPSLGRSIALAGVIAASGLSLGGCATKDDIAEAIAPLSERVATLESRVQANEAATQSAAGAAQSANQRLDQLTPRVDTLEQQQQARKRPRN
jgi:outer membrane murein-binding lipoprotein Lpp